MVRSLGWEDPSKKKMTTHSSILAWEIPWTEEPGMGHAWHGQRSYSPSGRKVLDPTEQQQQLV